MDEFARRHAVGVTAKEWHTDLVSLIEDTKEEVRSVSNRMITFPGHLRHTGTTHTDKDVPHTLLININYF